MPTNRKLVFANDQIYHVFNRGVEKRPTFTDTREYKRVLQAAEFYQFTSLPLRLSKYLLLQNDKRDELTQTFQSKRCEILAYCFMLNHFHFLLRQKEDNGISTFMSDFTNSYTKYFNTKHERVGPLFQGLFKAVRVEDDEQLVHVSRYIHLNPVASYLISVDDLRRFMWSSYQEYVADPLSNICETRLVLDLFPSKAKYEEFVLDQADYARELDRIKHLVLEK